MHIRVAILVISVHIVTKLVVFRSFFMVGSRSGVIRSRSGVIGSRSWVIGSRGRVVRGRRGVRVTSVGYCHEGTD